MLTCPMADRVLAENILQVGAAGRQFLEPAGTESGRFSSPDESCISSYARLTPVPATYRLTETEGGWTWRFAVFLFFRHTPAGDRSS
jgi:hypothetical protein